MWDMPFAVQITNELGTVLRRSEALIAVFILLKGATPDKWNRPS
jgi:hypothetical protein